MSKCKSFKGKKKETLKQVLHPTNRARTHSTPGIASFMLYDCTAKVCLSSLLCISQEIGLTWYTCQQLQKTEQRLQHKEHSDRSTSMIFIYCLSMSSLDVLLHLHSHYNCSLDINTMGFCCSQVIWIDRKGDSKQQRRNPKWKGRNNNYLL